MHKVSCSIVHTLPDLKKRNINSAHRLQMMTHTSQQHQNHASLLRLLQDLCSVTDVLPDHLWLTGVHIEWQNQLGSGGEARVYLGRWSRDSKKEKIVVRIANAFNKPQASKDQTRDILKVGSYSNEGADLLAKPNLYSIACAPRSAYAFSSLASQYTAATWSFQTPI